MLINLQKSPRVLSKIFTGFESCFFKCLPIVRGMSAFRVSSWCASDNAAAPWGLPDPRSCQSAMTYVFLGEPVTIISPVAWPFSVPTVVASALFFHKAYRLAWHFTKLQRALWVSVSISFLLPSWSQLFLGGSRTLWLSHHWLRCGKSEQLLTFSC